MTADASYRLLFSSPHMVRSLFDGIIKESWLDILDWNKMQPLPTDYISHQLRSRQGDRVWRVPRRDGADLCLLLMLEHQSRPERYMALRVPGYCCLLYESLLQHKALSRRQRLPAILPIVLYSGTRPWKASLDTAGLVDPVPPGLAPYMLQMRYLLIDEGALVRSGKLPANNLAALLFQLEHNRGIEHVQDLMQTIWNATQGPQFAELRRAFAAWARYVLLPRALPDVELGDNLGNLLEIKDMLADHSRSWIHQWKREGKKEGKMEGRVEGAAAILTRQLSQKFGPLPHLATRKLAAASVAQLEAWSLNLLDADTLDEVFKD